MVPADTFRIWERQRELARHKEREKRTRALIDAARARVLLSMAILHVR